MATYFHGSSEIQADGLQTLYLMNPNYVGYSDTQQHHHQQPPNMLFLDSASAAANALHNASISHAPPPPSQHFVGIPLPAIGSANSDDPSRPSVHEIPTLHGMVPRFHYNLWGSVDQASTGNNPQMATPLVSPTTHQQGLSLTLSSQQPGFRPHSGRENEISGQGPVTLISPGSGEDVRGSGGSPSSVSNGISGMQSVILGSKYLKAAQQLLDEVVNVGKAIKADTAGEGAKEKAKMSRESVAAVASGGDGSTGGETSSKRAAELTTAQRQELQMKKAKLVNMLDEVEQRYRTYHHQMQVVVSSFEQAAGSGSAKSYTALALQTISKQFRCLKDAITTQIKATGKILGEDDSFGGKGEGASRLKFVDHHLRQQRALQQLGMIQHNAWRPQRGLPERAVSVLRAWLFEHFLHPYPKDTDKHMLAKQTGLTRSQVSNWFINARVRLWKPMVEEMYVEEMKDQEQNGSENKTEPNKDSTSKSSALEENSTAFQMDQSKQERPINQIASPTDQIPNPAASTSLQPRPGFSLIGPSSEMESFAQKSPKKPRSSDFHNSPSSILSMDMDMKHGETTKGLMSENFSLLQGNTSHGGGFSGYPIGDLTRFDQDHQHLAARYHGNSVSLTLGLPHCESLSLSGTQPSYLTNQNIHLGGSRMDVGSIETPFNALNPPQSSHSSTGYENINIQNRKRFAAQLLPDFVA